MRLRFGAPLQLNQAGLRQLSDRGFPAHAGMDPTHHQTTPQQEGLPRTRGDGPTTTGALTATVEASPHTRGWTPPTTKPHPNRRGFPAHAGMDPAPGPSRRRPAWLPRTRGDGPGTCVSTVHSDVPMASPHTRGWTHGGLRHVNGVDRGLPRTRGDGPVDVSQVRAEWHRWTSPHTRGWTAGSPSGSDGATGKNRLPRTRGDGPATTRACTHSPSASPHTRGWTPACDGAGAGLIGFPAHAGMDLSQAMTSSIRSRLPRTRGDGPRVAFANRIPGRASPRAHAGMDPLHIPQTAC